MNQSKKVHKTIRFWINNSAFALCSKRVEKEKSRMCAFLAFYVASTSTIFSLPEKKKKCTPEFIISTLCQSITRECTSSIRFSINTSCCTPRTSFLLPLNCTLSKLFGLCCFENNESSIDMQTLVVERPFPSSSLFLRNFSN